MACKLEVWGYRQTCGIGAAVDSVARARKKTTASYIVGEGV